MGCVWSHTEPEPPFREDQTESTVHGQSSIDERRTTVGVAMTSEASPAQDPANDSSTGTTTELTTESDAESVFNICGVRYEFKQTVLRSDEHILEVYRRFEELHLEGSDCNVTITCGEMSVRAHKELLSERIPFFNCLFARGFMEQSSAVVSLSTQFCPLDVGSVRALIGYAYTGELALTTDNATRLLETAVYLQMESIVGACADFLVARVRCESALSLLAHFRSVGVHHRALWRFIDANFVPITLTTAFVALTASDLIHILQRDTLRIDGEAQVVEAVSRWIEVGSERWKDAPRLLSHVRLSSLRNSYIADCIASKDWTKDNPEYMDLIERHKNPTSRGRRCDRFCPDSIRIVFLFFYDSTYGGFRTFNPQSGVWKDVPRTTWHPCRYGRAVNIANQVFFIGDHDRMSRVLDVTTNEWSRLAATPGRRDDGAVGVIDSIIYYAGGQYNLNPTSSLIALDVRDQNPLWTEFAAMAVARYDAASCVCNGRLYIFGGEGDVTLDTCEVYDPESNTWTPIASMRRPASCHTALAVGNKIIVAGGKNDNGFEEYCPLTDTWRALPNMPGPSAAPFLIFSNGRVIVLPDIFNPSILNEVHVWVYDVVHCVWATVSTALSYSWSDDCPVSIPIPATVPLPLIALETARKWEESTNDE